MRRNYLQQTSLFLQFSVTLCVPPLQQLLLVTTKLSSLLAFLLLLPSLQEDVACSCGAHTTEETRRYFHLRDVPGFAGAWLGGRVSSLAAGWHPLCSTTKRTVCVGQFHVLRGWQAWDQEKRRSERHQAMGVKVGAHANVSKTKDVTVMFPHRAVYWSATPQSNKTTFHWANSTEDIWGNALRMEVNNTGTMSQPVSQPSDSVLPFLIPLPLLALDSLLLLSSTNYEPCPTDPRTRCTHYLFPGYTYEAGDWSINTVWETNMWIVTETGIPTVIETVDWRTSRSHHNPSSDPTHVFYFDHFQPLKDEWTRPNEILKPDPFCLPFELKTRPKLKHLHQNAHLHGFAAENLLWRSQPDHVTTCSPEGGFFSSLGERFRGESTVFNIPDYCLA
ncbi:hypothetical protein QOT17_002148 [Balamuthia mandrillaris]